MKPIPDFLMFLEMPGTACRASSKPLALFRVLAGLILCCSGMMLFGLDAEAKDSKKNFSGGTKASSKDEMNGFRSAQFGMGEKNILKAIYRDFKIPKSRIKRQIHAKERTLSFEISVTDLLPNSGPSRIFYIFGYQSKKLIQVNLIWGRPVTDSPDAKSIVNTANQLRDHFMQKNFPEKGRLVNAPLKDGSILVFRGQDKRGRLTTLLLMNPEVEGSPKNENISLRLSYIENPDSPDIFRVGANDF